MTRLILTFLKSAWGTTSSTDDMISCRDLNVVVPSAKWQAKYKTTQNQSHIYDCYFVNVRLNVDFLSLMQRSFILLLWESSWVIISWCAHALHRFRRNIIYYMYVNININVSMCWNVTLSLFNYCPRVQLIDN